MSTSLFCTQDIIKYIIVGGLVYSILKLIPSQQISNKDLILILAVICISFICIDCTINKIKDNKESFADTNTNPNPNPNPNTNPNPNPNLNINSDSPRSKAARNRDDKSNSEPESPRTRARMARRELSKSNTEPTKLVSTNEIKTDSPRIRRDDDSRNQDESRNQQELVDRPRRSMNQNKSSNADNEDNYTTSDSNQNQLPKVACSLEVEKIRRELRGEIEFLKGQLESTISQTSNDKIAHKYFENLLHDLNENGMLDENDIENIKIKMRSNLLTIEEVISSLETLKKEGKVKVNGKANNKSNTDGKPKNDMEYTELPSDFYRPIGDKIANEWENDYTILNTNKWQVPMPKPPVCINTAPCKVCPTNSSDNVVNLKEWDNSRYVSQNKINKKWASDQANSMENK